MLFLAKGIFATPTELLVILTWNQFKCEIRNSRTWTAALKLPQVCPIKLVGWWFSRDLIHVETFGRERWFPNALWLDLSCGEAHLPTKFWHIFSPMQVIMSTRHCSYTITLFGTMSYRRKLMKQDVAFSWWIRNFMSVSKKLAASIRWPINIQRISLPFMYSVPMIEGSLAPKAAAERAQIQKFAKCLNKYFHLAEHVRVLCFPRFSYKSGRITVPLPNLLGVNKYFRLFNDQDKLSDEGYHQRSLPVRVDNRGRKMLPLPIDMDDARFYQDFDHLNDYFGKPFDGNGTVFGPFAQLRSLAIQGSAKFDLIHVDIDAFPSLERLSVNNCFNSVIILFTQFK